MQTLLETPSVVVSRFDHGTGPVPAGAAEETCDHYCANFIDSDEPHTLASLASSVGMSAFHFARVFRSPIGAPPHRLLRDVRLDLVRSVLLAGESVTTTCYAVGFGNLSHFIRSFRRRFGTAPSLLRKKAQAGTSSDVA